MPKWISFHTKIRKSSCVNARAILTAAYQVLPEVGYPPIGVPPTRSNGGVPEVGYNAPCQGNPPAGVPPPPLWIWLGYPPPPGVDRRMDGWTDTCQNITFPRTTYAVGNNCVQLCRKYIYYLGIGKNRTSVEQNLQSNLPVSKMSEIPEKFRVKSLSMFVYESLEVTVYDTF